MKFFSSFLLVAFLYSTEVSALLPTGGHFCKTNYSPLESHQLRSLPARDGATTDNGTTNNNENNEHNEQLSEPAYFENISNSKLVSKTSNVNNNNAILARRNVLASLSTITFLSQSANAIDNPLNLKGTFWETGQLYEKSNIPLIPDDDDDSSDINQQFFTILDGTVEALHSSTLTEAITDGKYGTASRLLRGGLISESRLRIAANALMDNIPEEKEDALYKSSESFRFFLRYLEVLDAEVEAASRPFGGGSGESDPRMKILTRLGEVEVSLKVFLKNVRSGLG